MEAKPDRADWIRTALERYEKPLLRYATRITGNAELARDVVQETFMRLCAAERAKVEGHLAAWLYTVARNHALNVRKKESRMFHYGESEAVERAGARAGSPAAKPPDEAHLLVFDALKGLPEKQQEACRLKFEDDLSYREISQVMNVSLGTVSNLVAAALDTIRKQLRARGDLAQEA